MPAIILVDGRSGSGKTTLARRIVAGWPLPVAVHHIRLDDIYPGWDGLRAAHDHLLEHVLEALAAGRPARWRRWDWTADAPAEWHPVARDTSLVIDGAGALTEATRALATRGIWVELDDATRKRRALDRDGDSYAEHWDRWAAQESAFIGRETPVRFADLEVDGNRVHDYPI